MEGENVLDEIVQDVEELFDYQPKPGGMIDRHRREAARREAAQKEAEQSAEHVEERTYKAVKVVVLSPEVANVNVVNIPAGGTGQILPNSPYRYSATIVASTAITIGKDQGQALGGAGFPIAANTPFPVRSRAQLWASAVGACVVTVFTEHYGPELY